MQKAKIKMQNDKAKFKDEFKRRVYKFALDVIGTEVSKRMQVLVGTAQRFR
jgi:hypothetical protein